VNAPKETTPPDEKTLSWEIEHLLNDLEKSEREYQLATATTDAARLEKARRRLMAVVFALTDFWRVEREAMIKAAAGLCLFLLVGCLPPPPHDCVTAGGMYVQNGDCAEVGELQGRIEAEVGRSFLQGALLVVRTSGLDTNGCFSGVRNHRCPAARLDARADLLRARGLPPVPGLP
jgi:hypothetical protein